MRVLGVILTTTVLLSSLPAHADPGTRREAVARRFGAALGATWSSIEQAYQQRGTACWRSGTDSLTCPAALTAALDGARVSYWFRDRRLTEVAVFVPASPDIAALLARKDALVRALRSQLGVPKTSHHIPAGFAGAGKRERAAMVMSGRASWLYSWPGTPEVSVELGLVAARPVLVVRAHDTAHISCSGRKLADLLIDLFPPADPSTRAASATRLGRCGIPRAVGPLVATMTSSSPARVRSAAVGALADIGGAPAIAALRAALHGDANLKVRRQALRALGRLGQVKDAVRIAADPHQPEGLRAEAVAQQVTNGAPVPASLAASTGELGATVRVLARIVGTGPTSRAHRHIVAGSDRGRSQAGAGRGTPPAARATASSALAASAPAKVASGSPVLEPDARAPSVVKPAGQPAGSRGATDGTALAITTTTAASAALFSTLAGMASVGSVGSLLLTGSAGAVIGGGTSLGVFRFSHTRPTLEQAAWYSNVVAWGALAGLEGWQVTRDRSARVRFGLLASGEVAGLGLGAWSAARYHFSAAQTVLADSLVLGASLGEVGTDLVRGQEIHSSVAKALSLPPLMLGSAILAHTIRPDHDDVVTMATLTPSLATTGALLTAGLREVSLASRETVGGAALGLSAGYLGSTLLASRLDIPVLDSEAIAAGTMAGQGLGLGVHMMMAPRDRARWPLGAALGGIGFGTAALLAAPHVHPGPAWRGLTAAGAGYGAGTWLAAAVAGKGDPRDAPRLPGGILAGSILGATSGLVASEWFHPTPRDHVEAAAATAAGASAGLGLVRLTSDTRGTADSAGVLVGAAGGLALGATAAHLGGVRRPDGEGYALGAAVGGVVGTLAPSLGAEQWSGDRRAQGGGFFGAGFGALAGAAVTRVLGATDGQVAASAAAAGFGASIGLGVGMLDPAGGSRPVRVGVVAGQLGALTAQIAAERWLRLGDGVGGAAGGMALSGAVAGTALGSLAASWVSPDRVTDRQVAGGVVAGASAGVATGLVLSKWFSPTAADHRVALASGVLGHSFGLGLYQLAVDRPDPASRGEATARLAGAALGLSAGAVAAHAVDFTPTDQVAGVFGTGYGALLGSLAPSLGDASWAWNRTSKGGANLGAALGGALGLSVSRATGASPADVAVPVIGASLGGTAGLGIGLLASDHGSQPGRIGAFAGIVGAGAGAALAARPLELTAHLDQRPRLATGGGLLGTGYGMLLAGAIHADAVRGRHVLGGALAGSATGLGAGLAAARFLDPSPTDMAVAYGGALLGAGAGLGLSHLTMDAKGRGDDSLTLAGSILALGGAGLTQRFSPLRRDDGDALALGMAYGGIAGILAPTLADATFPGFNRDTSGGLLLGASAGGIGGALLAHATGASRRTIELAGLGSAHGLATGLGIGMLLGDSGHSQAQRIGSVAGATAGLALGGLWLPRADFSAADRWLIGASTAVGGWTGLLVPALGHADVSNVDARRFAGGTIAGAGLGSLAGALAASRVDVDPDRIRKALVIDSMFTAAGFGAGAVASTRDDAPIWGGLGAGTTGLVLGGALADHIQIDRDATPLLAVAAAHGAWFGGWLPHLFSDHPTSRVETGATAAGTFGALGLAALASRRLHLLPAEAGKLTLASSIGTSIAGGTALVADGWSPRARVGLMLGGTAAGLTLGSWLMPSVDLDLRGRGMAAIGGLLGVSEGLTFAWAGGADGDAAYWGSALVGGGLGATLGLAGSSSNSLTAQRALVSSGFAAWGGWIGSFSGSLLGTDARTIVMGGLVGANLGALSGYGITRGDWFKADDFGWLSLAGAVGTVGGAGVGALLSSKSDRAPILAGLAAGPVAGMAAGAVMLPVLRRLGGGAGTAHARASLSSRKQRQPRSGHLLSQLFHVADWQPMFGALPATGLGPTAPAVGGGVTGRWN